MELKELSDQLNAASAEIKNAQAKMAEELESKGKVAEETKAALEEHQTKFDELVAQFKTMDDKLIDLEKEAKRFRPGGDAAEKKTLGQLFTESELYQGVKESQRGNNQPLQIQRKDITSLTSSAGALIRSDRDPEVYRNPNRPNRIRDLIPSVPVASGSVEVMRQTSYDNQAGPQGTDSGAGAGEMQEKNQSDIVWELVTYTVKTIAHWIPASRQALSDAPMLQSLIDTELTYGLELEADRQLLLGDGTGQNVTGLLVDADIPDIGEIEAGTDPDAVPAAMIDHIRAAITECQTNEYYNINGLVLNPVDWETLETAKATDGHYLLMQFPTNGAQERLWRVPVVITNAMPEGEFLLGDWVMGAKIYDRESVSVRVSESHADYFIRNGVAILAEERYAFAINRPLAFAKGSFDVAA